MADGGNCYLRNQCEIRLVIEYQFQEYLWQRLNPSSVTTLYAEYTDIEGNSRTKRYWEGSTRWVASSHILARPSVVTLVGFTLAVHVIFLVGSVFHPNTILLFHAPHCWLILCRTSLQFVSIRNFPWLCDCRNCNRASYASWEYWDIGSCFQESGHIISVILIVWLSLTPFKSSYEMNLYFFYPLQL